jgi:uncharacterized protein (TIGR02284 family)
MDNERIIHVLNDLIEKCKDGEYGFRTSAEHVKAPELRQLLASRADDCALGASELQAQVVQLGGKPDTGGSVSGAMHRGWVSVKATLSGYTDQAVLEECERGEDSAMTAYMKALKDPLPDAVRLVVDRQYLGVKRNHDVIRELRDRERAASERHA